MWVFSTQTSDGLGRWCVGAGDRLGADVASTSSTAWIWAPVLQAPAPFSKATMCDVRPGDARAFPGRASTRSAN